MLAYFLALAVGLGSIAVYLAAFFFPEIHRKNDFIWSGVGLFYALVLWVFARRISGGLLLGHVASVSLLGWLGWQTLSLRRQLTPQKQQTQVPSAEKVKTTVQEQVNKLPFQQQLAQLQRSIGNTFSGAKNEVQKKTSDVPKFGAPSKPIGKPNVEINDRRTPVQEQQTDVAATPNVESKTESVPEAIPPSPPSPELVEAAQAHTEVEETIQTHTPVKEIPPSSDKMPPNPT
ncbi:MAG: Ycf66 family protein [Rhizonema sp. PD38]|nr:Ycf66 family protein [Rhizonema sp. PD38]